MKMNKFRFQVGLVVLIVLGTLFFLNACGGGSGAPVSPAPQSKPSTPQVEPSTPPPVEPLMPAQTQPMTPPPSTPPAVQPPPATSTGTEIKVTLKDGNFPAEIRVKVGERVVFVVTNTGSVMHTFEFPDFDEMRYKEIEKGQTARIEWIVPDKKGEWDAGCFLTEEGFHEGMEGILIIE